MPLYDLYKQTRPSVRGLAISSYYTYFSMPVKRLDSGFSGQKMKMIFHGEVLMMK